MIRFESDYTEGAHPKIIEALVRTNEEQNPGYGVDRHCERARALIKDLCGNPDLGVEFLVGGTQANVTVIDAMLRSYQGVFCVETGHINIHETGAIEATGHKVIGLPTKDGKICAQQIRNAMDMHFADEAHEHIPQPKLVYLSNPTELGTIYSKEELKEISDVCKAYKLYLFVDGARLGYGLAAKGNDLTFTDLAELTDVFYIGGTKVGAMFGEAVVISNPVLAEDFRYIMKQHGAMLAKGWLLGLQYEALMEDDLYLKIAAHADCLADKIRDTLSELNYPLLVEGVTNQIFPILPDMLLDKLKENFTFSEQLRIDNNHRAVRFCTSWATNEEAVDALCEELRKLSV